MTKIFPNRVQTTSSILSQSISSEVYVEWGMPEPLPPTPWYEIFPWKFIIPGLIGVILTVIFRDAIPRFHKYLKERAVTVGE